MLFLLFIVLTFKILFLSIVNEIIHQLKRMINNTLQLTMYCHIHIYLRPSCIMDFKTFNIHTSPTLTYLLILRNMSQFKLFEIYNDLVVLKTK